MKHKEIHLKVKNGKIVEFTTFGISDNGNGTGHQEITLKEIALVNELLKQKQEKIMNKQKDEVNKLKFSVGKCTPYKAIVLPENAPLSLVIRLLNDMHLDITRDECKSFWKQYTQTIYTAEIEV